LLSCNRGEACPDPALDVLHDDRLVEVVEEVVESCSVLSRTEPSTTVPWGCGMEAVAYHGQPGHGTVGTVVKPHRWIPPGRRGLVQTAVKRGRSNRRVLPGVCFATDVVRRSLSAFSKAFDARTVPFK
jgi:hypothetical protein